MLAGLERVGVNIRQIKNIVVIWGITMNNKNKNSSKRKDSHSREHTSNLRSTSKSSEKSKHRSDSKLLLKLRHPDASQLNAGDDSARLLPNTVLNRISSKKAASNKQVESSNEYYNYRVKSKSKGKLAGPEEDSLRHMYLNSVYMHKEAPDPHSTSTNEHLTRHKEEEPTHSNPQLINKIRLLEKNGAIDANGKFVVREKSGHEHGNHTDSLQTISIYEGEKKKDRLRKKEKTRKQIIKTKPAKNETSRLIAVRSADKFAKKKEPRDVNSPSILQNHTLKHYEFDASQINELRDNPYKVQEVKANHPVPSTRTSKTILSEETQTSPPQGVEHNYSPSSMQVNIDFIIREINEEKGARLSSAKLKAILKDGLLVERVKCIEFLSKLCISLSIRRESHSLAVFYIDKYLLQLGQAVSREELKLISMTALLLALKVDDGIMSRKLCHEYMSHMELILNMSNKTSSKSKSIMKYKEAISAFSSKENSATLGKSKSQASISDLPSKGEMKKSRKEEAVTHSREMARVLALELDMLLKFSFRLVRRTSTYWVDILTLLWDNYITEEITWELELLFRSEKNKKNISHCYQIMERLALDLDAYNYSTPLLALSAIYVVVRMRLEEQKEGQHEQEIYGRYVSSLGKSTNLIFYDNVGINELFGDFLYEFELTLSEIIECIQFVGRNLMLTMRPFAFTARSQYVACRTHEHQLSIYEGNSDIYKAVEDKY